jgi:high-affinity iron transporter
MTLVAAMMIVYMVKWMRENGRTLKHTMQNSLEKKSSLRWRNISILTVVAVAFAREASEASIFIYALGVGSITPFSIKILGLLGLGILLAMATIFILQLGNKIFSWKIFFKLTEILLLLLGGGLLLNAIDHLIVAGLLTPLQNKIWDTSFLIHEGGMLSPMLSSFTGYRAAPSLTDLIVYSSYWIFIYFLLKPNKGKSHA